MIVIGGGSLGRRKPSVWMENMREIIEWWNRRIHKIGVTVYNTYVWNNIWSTFITRSDYLCWFRFFIISSG